MAACHLEIGPQRNPSRSQGASSASTRSIMHCVSLTAHFDPELAINTGVPVSDVRRHVLKTKVTVADTRHRDVAMTRTPKQESFDACTVSLSFSVTW